MTQSEVEISCGEALWEISRHAEQDIAKDRRARLENHFRKCSRCRGVVDGMGNLLRLVGDGLGFARSPGLSRRLRERIAASRRH